LDVVGRMITRSRLIEGDEAHPHTGWHDLDELVSRFPRGDKATRCDIRRLHRKRGIEREHDRWFVRDLRRKGMPGSRDDEQAACHQVHGGDEMAPEARSSGCHGFR
jgi:hypothetical protein